MVRADAYGACVVGELQAQRQSHWRRRGAVALVTVLATLAATIPIVLLIGWSSAPTPLELQQVPLATVPQSLCEKEGDVDCFVGAKMAEVPEEKEYALPPSPQQVELERQLKTDTEEIGLLRNSLAAVIRTENALIAKYKKLAEQRIKTIPGPRGPPGPPGASIVGAPGEPGEQGMAGPPGPPGAAGPRGVPGEIGATGAPGRPGETGRDGRRGLPGPRGPAGPVGPPGKAGYEGPIGRQGPPGKVGSPGPAGPQGPMGIPGPVGPAGKDGTIGPRGLNGIPGAPGIPGPQGIQGPPGSSGPAGPPGQVGIAGRVGRRGPPGPVGKPTRVSVYWGAGVDRKREGRLFVDSLVKVAGAEITYFYHFDEAELPIAMRSHIIAIPPLAPHAKPKVCDLCRNGLVGYVQQGHKIIVGGGKGSLAWIDDVFGTRLIPAKIGAPAVYQSTSGKTAFMDAAGNLPDVNGVMGATVRSLGSHKFKQRLKAVYTQGSSAAVFWLKTGQGYLVYFGYNWFTPEAIDDISQWESALGAAFKL